MTDDQGNLYTDVMAITVLNRQKLNAILKWKWEGMKAKLMAGDIAGAVGYFVENYKEKYREAFSLLTDEIPAIMTNMQDIEVVYVKSKVAKYRIKRMQDIDGKSLELAYYIYFSQNTDGKWSINRF